VNTDLHGYSETPIFLALSTPEERRRYALAVLRDHPEQPDERLFSAEWVVMEIALKELNLPSERNESCDLINKFVQVLKRGGCLPPLIVLMDPSGTLRLLDGLQRYRALRRLRRSSYPCLLGRCRAA
jgi:hypothetical protein